jgi:hypothetical protein
MTLELTGYEPTVMSADLIHNVMNMDGQRVRKWRHKGDFEGGEKMGKTYLYTIREITKLVIMSAMLDAGFSTHSASVASEMGCNSAIGHCFRRARLISLWTAPDEIEEATKLIREKPEALRDLLTPGDNSWTFNEPHIYLVSGGDDIDDWLLADNRDDFDNFEDYILPVTYLDLRKVADRVIGVLEAFAVSQMHPTEMMHSEPGPITQVAFYSKRWNENTDNVSIMAVSLDPAIPTLPEGCSDKKPDLKIVN